MGCFQGVWCIAELRTKLAYRKTLGVAMLNQGHVMCSIYHIGMVSRSFRGSLVYSKIAHHRQIGRISKNSWNRDAASCIANDRYLLALTTRHYHLNIMYYQARAKSTEYQDCC
jgi:hypothetical protein